MSSTRGIGPARGQRDRDRIVADEALGAAGGRHQRPGIAHRHADAAGVGSAERVTARGAEMEAVANGDRGGAEPCRALDRQRHRLLAGQLAERMAGVEHEGAIPVRDDLRLALDRYRAAADSLDIHVDQHHAMRSHAFEIGIDEPLRETLGCVVGKPARREHAPDQRAERFGGNRDRFGSGHEGDTCRLG